MEICSVQQYAVACLIQKGHQDQGMICAILDRSLQSWNLPNKKPTTVWTKKLSLSPVERSTNYPCALKNLSSKWIILTKSYKGVLFRRFDQTSLNRHLLRIRKFSINLPWLRHNFLKIHKFNALHRLWVSFNLVRIRIHAIIRTTAAPGSARRHSQRSCPTKNLPPSITCYAYWKWSGFTYIPIIRTGFVDGKFCCSFWWTKSRKAHAKKRFLSPAENYPLNKKPT